MSISAELNERIKQRVQVYEALPQCSGSARLDFDGRPSVVEAVSSAIMFAWPYSTYSVLKALSWSLTHPPQGDDWWSEVDALLNLLDVSGEEQPEAYRRMESRRGTEYAARRRAESKKRAGYWTAEVMTWPHDDQMVIRDWLLLASTWPFVQDLFAFETQAAIAFWSELARQSGAQSAGV
jgi:hypothetical protein